MYENIISIHNVLKKKTTQLNFQPAQYLKKLAKIILKKKLKKRKKRRRSQFWVKKKREKKHVKKKKKKQKPKKKKQTPTVKNLRVLEQLLISVC